MIFGTYNIHLRNKGFFENVKNSKHDGPILIHVRTQKGKGYKPAEDSGDKYHGVSKFNIATGEQKKAKSNFPT